MAGEDTSLSGLAGRYASALLDLADENKKLDDVAEDLRTLEAAVSQSEELRRLIRSPVFSRAEQSKAISAVAEKLGIGDLTRRFLLVVAQNRRLFALPEMIRAYLEELARRRGEVTAHVVSAIELDEEQRKALVEALKSTAGGKVQVDVKVDPSLIGGLIVRIGSRMIDNSLRGKLRRLQYAMKGVG